MLIAFALQMERSQGGSREQRAQRQPRGEPLEAGGSGGR